MENVLPRARPKIGPLMRGFGFAAFSASQLTVLPTPPWLSCLLSSLPFLTSTMLLLTRSRPLFASAARAGLGMREFTTTRRALSADDVRAASAKIFTQQEVADGIAALTAAGYDASTAWEQRVVWGDHDQFQHVNNVHYVRWFESARMFFAESLTKDKHFMEERKQGVLRGTGQSFILAGINVRYRRPIVYPDTVSILNPQHQREREREREEVANSRV